jgi:hypothetical protein
MPKGDTVRIEEPGDAETDDTILFCGGGASGTHHHATVIRQGALPIFNKAVTLEVTEDKIGHRTVTGEQAAALAWLFAQFR